MNSFPLRAQTLTGELYTFSMLDIPMRISNKTFVLARKPNSPIMRLDDITRGMDIPGLFEGDIIKANGKEYLINYMRGFRASSSDSVAYLDELEDYQVIGNIYTNEFPIKCALLRKIVYKYRDNKIKIDDITGIYNGYAIVRGVTDRLCPDELQQDAGFTYNNTKVFFGDIVEGEVLTMYCGRPVINVNDKIYDVIRKTNIGGKEKC